jgi:alpha-tubulin suppressor-like RCC1 family protein
MTRRLSCLALLWALAACSSDPDGPAPTPDAGAEPDGGDVVFPDAGPNEDAGANPGEDAGEQDGLIITVEVDPKIFCIESCYFVKVGDTRPLVATVTDADGTPREDVQVTWSTSDESKATVSSAGLLTATGVGQVNAIASAEGASGSATFTVEPARITRIEVDPSDVTLAQLGDTAQITATAYDANEQLVEDPDFQWYSSNELVLSVDATGKITGVGQGTAFVWVTTPNAVTEGQVRVVVVSPLPTAAGWQLAEIAGGGSHGCGALASGKTYCWGWNYWGQLGNGERGSELDIFPTPLPVLGDHVFHGLTASESHSCALETNGDAYCWGLNGAGALGVSDPEVGGSTIPIAVEGGLRFSEISAGYDHTCALDGDGKAYCFGFNEYGCLGDDSFDDRNNPAAVSGELAFTKIRAGYATSCGLTADGALYCWGSDEFGNTGNGEATEPAGYDTPQLVAGGHVFTDFDLMASHVCALTSAGEAYCWGRNEGFQVGDGGDDQPRDAPVAVQTDLVFAQIAVGIWHSCGRTAAGAVYCWGLNENGQFGSGTIESSKTPVKTAGDHVFTHIDAGFYYTCGQTADGATYCWGHSGEGQLGTGFGGPGVLSVVPWPLKDPG